MRLTTRAKQSSSTFAAGPSLNGVLASPPKRPSPANHSTAPAATSGKPRFKVTALVVNSEYCIAPASYAILQVVSYNRPHNTPIQCSKRCSKHHADAIPSSSSPCVWHAGHNHKLLDWWNPQQDYTTTPAPAPSPSLLPLDSRLSLTTPITF